MSSAVFAEVSPSFFSTMESAAMQSSPPVISFGYIIQLVFSLGVVIGAIFLTTKYVLPRFTPGTSGNYINVVDRVVLEPQVTSYILNVEKKFYVVVVSNKTATLIDKLDSFENE